VVRTHHQWESFRNYGFIVFDLNIKVQNHPNYNKLPVVNTYTTNIINESNFSFIRPYGFITYMSYGKIYAGLVDYGANTPTIFKLFGTESDGSRNLKGPRFHWVLDGLVFWIRKKSKIRVYQINRCKKSKTIESFSLIKEFDEGPFKRSYNLNLFETPKGNLAHVLEIIESTNFEDLDERNPKKLKYWQNYFDKQRNKDSKLYFHISSEVLKYSNERQIFPSFIPAPTEPRITDKVFLAGGRLIQFSNLHK
jgi:hypothetical protein